MICVAEPKNELFGIPLGVLTSQRLHDALRNEGWQKIGYGKFSSVYGRDDVALKIFNDETYLSYIERVIKPENPAFPRILDGPYKGDRLCAVFLERLEPLDPSDHALIASLGTLAERHRLRGSLDRDDLLLLIAQERLGQDAVRALESIVNFACASWYYTDIKPQNVMRRTCGQYVITDPFH